MILNIPDEVMASSLSVSAKMTVAVAMNHPLHTRAEVAKLLNIHRSSVHNAIKKAKTEGIDIDTECRDIATECSDIATECRNIATPYLVGSSSSSGERERKTQILEAKPPTREEVAAHAVTVGAEAIVDEFYDTYSERGWMSKGEPLQNWKAMFRWWTKNKAAAPCVASRRKSRMSAEDARYAMDAETYE